MRKHLPLLLTALMTLGVATTSLAQSAPSAGGGAANAISEAVQGGSNPYRPPSGGSTDPEEARRAKCEALKEEFNATSKQRAYESSGTSTHNAQGRPVPKIERDTTRKDLQETYRANCT
ncbi:MULTISPECIES: hypothetical protein [Cupriavidus]|uniref:DUF4148 domain-containing protein n=1 Tax=Cupriavidus pinatubonensis (strain JMP 134 / LMG 1197) TaxID=264198 RepID=Q46ZB6_CUPPJ|nr:MULTISPECIES: hypothetical protein [Cupriavidus]QYY30462.1 hypothetical protein K2O51_24220 [Cupriavidus pinatubonensis]TPQ43170.1 hypothetical protein C2U69_03935 [Cupriavidus pinatubonensis]